MSKSQIIAEALKLSLVERAEVASLLLDSLENPSLEEASRVWGEIAAERYQEMKAEKSVVVELEKELRIVKTRLE
ncbi:MAG: addiction module protein [Meiothermus sp.]|nr:addiction module protein [Meiothermus sp.]